MLVILYVLESCVYIMSPVKDSGDVEMNETERDEYDITEFF